MHDVSIKSSEEDDFSAKRKMFRSRGRLFSEEEDVSVKGMTFQ